MTGVQTCALPISEIEEPFCEEEQALVYKADASTSPIPFLDEKIDETEHKTCPSTIESKCTQTVSKSVADSGCMTGPQSEHVSSGTCVLVCKTCGNATKSYSSIKFYTSLALAGLFAIFFAVTQFSPEIHKSYSRPPPI